MHTKIEIQEAMKEDPEKACNLLMDFVDKIFESDKEEVKDFKEEWNSETRLASLLQYDTEIDEGDFFGRFDEWEENHGYKIQT